MFRTWLTRLAAWLSPAPPRPGAFGPGPPPRSRAPTPAELLAELKGTAWACASLNAAVCASFPPRLYVRTAAGTPEPRWPTRALTAPERRRLGPRGGSRVEEVTDHPLLDLLSSVNPVHNAFDLLELLTLSQEVHGCAYWLIDDGPLGTPAAIWPLPAHLVTPWRDPDSHNLVDAYLYRGGGEERLPPERVLAFRYPDPRDPYAAGASPLRACFEQARLA